MVHVAPGAKVAGQLFVSVKSRAYIPVIPIFEMFRFVVPVLESVTFWVVEEPCAHLSNVSEVGERRAPGFVPAGEPVPLRVTVWMLPGF